MTEADSSAIREALASYCRAMDRMDRELARAVWHADGACHYDGFYEGPVDGLLDAIWAAHEGLYRHSHQLTTSLVEVDGDRAASETYVTATLWGHPTEDGMLEITSTGRYLDRWSKRDGRWAIDHRMELGDVTTTRTIPPGSFFRVSALTTRDTSDPSYALFAAITGRETPRPGS